ncbi:MAG: LLM class flavin-dependent oxidoreductase [Candidatus Bathyarchaeia archaeon]
MKNRIGFAVPEELGISEALACSRLAETKGFESVWFTEDYYFVDPVGLAAATAVTTTRITIGIGVTNVYTRSIPLIAMTAATLDGIANGRFILGIGLGVRERIMQQGYEPKKNSLQAIRESVEIIRRLIAKETVSYDGRVFRERDVQLAFNPLRPRIPIYLAAMGPRMLQLAGEIADGVLLSVFTPINFLKLVRENLAIGAERAGRNLDEIDVAGYIVLSASDDSLTAREAAKPTLLTELVHEEFDSLMASTALDVGSVEAVRGAISARDFEGAKAQVTDEMIDAFLVAGTPRECRAKLEQQRAAGLKLPIILPIPEGVEAAVRVATENQ